MHVFYDLFYFLAAIIYLPVFLLRRKFHRGFISRFGVLPKGLSLDRPLWIHAVSVGEATLIRGLVEELRLAFPGKRFVISTVTPTGNKIARELAAEGDLVTYLPLDFSFIVASVLKRIKPSLFVVAETEIWPNLLGCLYKSRIPVIVINGRISDNSFRGYFGIRFLIKPILNKITLFCVQTERDARRLLHLGLEKKRLRITGNMKFDLKPEALNFKASGLRLKYDEELWVCGSTHPGEEEIILDAYRGLLAEFPGLRLLLAPRHPDRADEVAGLVRKTGLQPLKTSLLRQSQAQSKAVYILDSVGELLSFYSIAHIVFVGGSLVAKGGHNILEPAALGKPIIFGPQMFNFRDIARLFLQEKAALLARNREELENSVRNLLSDPALMAALGRHARELLVQNQGATQRNLHCIMELDGSFNRI